MKYHTEHRSYWQNSGMFLKSAHRQNHWNNKLLPADWLEDLLQRVKSEQTSHWLMEGTA